MTHEERFRQKVWKAADGCWLWMGRRDPRGYGLFSDRKNWRAHRWAYQYFVAPIPDGLFVCHHCDNPPCVNPEHLFVGTHTDNMRDAVQKGRIVGWQSRKTRCKRGHALSGSNVYRIPSGGRECKECRRHKEARRFAERTPEQRACKLSQQRESERKRRARVANGSH